MKRIIVRRNRKLYALVDDEDYARVARHNWYHMGGYARAQIDGSAVLLHRFILDAPCGAFVDHVNGNGLDNRRSNIRLCSPAENTHNSKRRTDNSSGHRGIAWEEDRQRWRAKITIYGTTVHLGYFKSLSEAVWVREQATRDLFGEFARAG